MFDDLGHRIREHHRQHIRRCTHGEHVAKCTVMLGLLGSEGLRALDTGAFAWAPELAAGLAIVACLIWIWET